MTSGAQQRVEWIDVAKAACILLVVLVHTQTYAGLVPWRTALPVAQGWEAVTASLRPLRMPLFFLVSGMLFARQLERPWPSGGRRRLIDLAHVYVIWALVSLFSLRWILGRPMPAAAETMLALSSGISEAWYLWALAVFLLIAWSSRKLPCWVPVGTAFLLPLLLPEPTYGVHSDMLRCLPFFLLGARLPQVALDLAAAATTARFVAALLLFMVAFATVRGTLADAAAVLAGLMGFPLAARLEQLRRWGRALGPQTLPIYVMHFPVVAGAGLLVAAAMPAWLASSSLFAIFYPMLMAALSVGACLLMHAFLVKAGCTWLFVAPAFLRQPTSAVGDAVPHRLELAEEA